MNRPYTRTTEQFPIYDKRSAREAINLTNGTKDKELRESILRRATNYVPDFVQKVKKNDQLDLSARYALR